MHSLNQEIKAFSRNNLRKQCTRVTTLTGKKIIETWKDARIHVVEEVEPSTGGGCGYVQDLSLDLQVGVIKPWLLLGSQDAAHDLDTLKKHKVTHILNAAYGVENAFLSDFIYKSISILDLPETNILSYFPECFEFIEQAKVKVYPITGIQKLLVPGGRKEDKKLMYVCLPKLCEKLHLFPKV
ncbi:dual specificity protein phosphatase 19 isoform X2 [Rhinolophus ferrumequinum]|uniref:dual specificity protein phosphatase 19 isoform X2 n=1 Tax=Rhinolophus ferrumequinum TaxID=59479 RepID=UPI00140F5A12|nr:dual specificity protein phosphatase 19 isoform X2 [Rhinolophus ferrumequinum]